MDKKRASILYLTTALILVVLAMWSIAYGSVRIPLYEVKAALAGDPTYETSYSIIRSIRLPRLCAAMILGGGLSVAGFLLQTFFRNPIAGPYVLGISSGAKLAVALTMILLLSAGVHISAFGMVAAAFAGAMVSMGFVLVLAGRVRRMSILVVCGIMISYICSAITDFVVAFADDSNIVNLHNWSLGSFSGMSWQHVRIMAVITLACVLGAWLLSKPMDAFRLGENYARNMGVNIKGLRLLLILLSSLLAACVTAFAGPISFVGIAIPHLVKRGLKTGKPICLIPGCFLAGSAATVLCDGIARTLFAPTELSISSVTAILLAPVVIVMMIGRKREEEVT